MVKGLKEGALGSSEVKERLPKAQGCTMGALHRQDHPAA